MKKLLLSATIGILSLNASANLAPTTGQLEIRKDAMSEYLANPVAPTYLPNTVETDNWRSNWFIDASGGANMFIGSPLGCADAFDRVMPLFRAHAGKWYTPSVGSRFSFEGFKIKSACLRPMGYRAYHMDMLWDVSYLWHRARDEPRWRVIPYFGLGCIYNTDLRTTPFAISYGVMGQYRLTPRMSLTMELGNIKTWKNYDGCGDSRELGDNILGLSAGLSLTIGKAGWKRVVDARPYMTRNEQLLAYALAVRDHNRALKTLHNRDQRVIDELKKILSIEGLLKKYSGRLDNIDADSLALSDQGCGYPKNDYSGLNSLMARINGHGYKSDDLSEDDIVKSYDDFVNRHDKGIDALPDGQSGSASEVDGDSNSDESSWTMYLDRISSGKLCIGAPVYFFFRIRTATLTDASQLVNLDEIARIANKYNLHIRVVGAADSATGSKSVNASLSRDRADYIAAQLKERGVKAENIKVSSRGGIDTWPSNEANRHTRIELYR